MKNKIFTHLEERTEIGFWITAMPIAAAILFALLILLSGCSPSKRITRIAANHPEAAAGMCAKFFPVKESSSTKIEYRQGATVYSHDTVVINCDSIIKIADLRNSEGRSVVRIPCPPSTYRVDTIRKDSVIVIENTAKVTMIASERDSWQALCIKAIAQRNLFLWLAIAFGGYLLIKNMLRLTIPALAGVLKNLP